MYYVNITIHCVINNSTYNTYYSSCSLEKRDPRRSDRHATTRCTPGMGIFEVTEGPFKMRTKKTCYFDGAFLTLDSNTRPSWFFLPRFSRNGSDMLRYVYYKNRWRTQDCVTASGRVVNVIFKRHKRLKNIITVITRRRISKHLKVKLLPSSLSKTWLRCCPPPWINPST